jgi:periplasmic protein TonB
METVEEGVLYKTLLHMETSKIMQADILDILFEGRNKDYGAYELRKTYNGRIVKALFVTGAVILLLFIGYYVSNASGGTKSKPVNVDDIQLANVKEDKTPPPVIPPPIKTPPPRVEMIRVTPPRIVPDEQVKPEEKPPENKDLDDVKIGADNITGVKDDGIAAPPVNDVGKGVIAAPKDDDNDGKPFMKVEVESIFPGGPAAWLRFLNKNLHYPDDALNNEIQGAVMVQFIVDKDGNVSDIEAVGGPDKGGLREEAIRVIKKSGKWTPAQQNGRYVKSYKRQPVTFSIGGQ